MSKSKKNKQSSKVFMMGILVTALIAVTLLMGMGGTPDSGKKQSSEHPIVVIETTGGRIGIELYPEATPITVKNYLEYVNEGFYDGTIFHRVIPGFVVQGGGFEEGMVPKETREPIKNEAFSKKISNLRGTVAMARANDPDSATSQFFINLSDNTFLDFQNSSNTGFGYCVFGKVIYGMDVVDDIAKATTGTYGQFDNVPLNSIKITSARVLKE